MVSETGSSFFTEGHMDSWTNGYLFAIFWRWSIPQYNVHVTYIICARIVVSNWAWHIITVLLRYAASRYMTNYKNVNHVLNVFKN